MGVDHVFHIGASHRVCQDYAIAGKIRDSAYAIISDGCSGIPDPGIPGSPFTDWGSRLLVRATLNFLSEGSSLDKNPYGVIFAAQRMAQLCRLPLSSLDATVMTALETPTGILAVQAGDGVVASQYADGSIRYWALSFGGNMPHYLSYLLNPCRHQTYLREAETITIRTGLKSINGWSVEETENPIPSTPVFCLNLGFPELVLIMSDGAESFQYQDGSAVDLHEVLDQLFAIKNFTGEFLTRRVNRFLKSFCRDHQWTHQDDFSVAAIHSPVSIPGIVLPQPPMNLSG
jgi:hypothetical protein